MEHIISRLPEILLGVFFTVGFGFATCALIKSLIDLGKPTDIDLMIARLKAITDEEHNKKEK